MAVLRLNPNNLHMDVIVGTSEEFKPVKEIAELQKEVDEFKEKVAVFLKDNFNTEVVAEIQEKLSNDPELEKIWVEFLQKDYTDKVKELNEKVKGINTRICSNYSDVISE